MINKEYNYSKEWQVLFNLSKGYGIQVIKDVQMDAILNKKINWFLNNGAAGVLVMLKEVFGSEAVQEFNTFLEYFLSNTDNPGHYYHSDTIKQDIKRMKFAAMEIDFKKYLEDLKQELIEIDKQKGRN